MARKRHNHLRRTLTVPRSHLAHSTRPAAFLAGLSTAGASALEVDKHQSGMGVAGEVAQRSSKHMN